MTEKKVVIDILGHNWGVSIVPQAYPRLLKSDGLACFKSKEIYLSGHLSREKLKKVLLEEYSYAFFFELGGHSTILSKLNNKENKKIVDEIMEKLYPDNKLKLQRYHTKGRERE